ncbi:MAG: isoprenyl transferase [Tenuifilaceae bacterium]|jgi:undecaprenyl diphosphate synthase|nr:isoprenyl transferase [Tenuifilaceae bacterium]
MSSIDSIDKEKLPAHIAIIMDGNGRWAKQQGKPRIFGHQNGARAVRSTIEISAELGIKYLTLYAFSSENWKRPKMEIEALMALLITTIDNELQNLIKNNIRLNVIGNINLLPDSVRKKLDYAIDKTAPCNGMTLILALSYSGRWEIIEAVRNICTDMQAKGLSPEKINDELFAQYLNTSKVPDPELLIRTSGELRLSNFLLWQTAYTELYFTKVLWPDFDKDEMLKAILSYQCRERRFGKTTEQL